MKQLLHTLKIYAVFFLPFYTLAQSEEVTGRDFALFQLATGYQTTAEITDSSFFCWGVMRGQAQLIPGLNFHEPPRSLPVIHVSYIDAQAYCQWKESRLITESEFWDYAATDTLKINTNLLDGYLQKNVNIIGNVWEWVDEGFIVGGSYLCEQSTCAGYKKENKRKVSKDTSSNIISFRCKDL